MNEESSTKTGIGPIGLLWVALIILKILGYLDIMSWWLIIPFPLIAYISVVTISFIGGMLIGVILFLSYTVISTFEKIFKLGKK